MRSKPKRSTPAPESTKGQETASDDTVILVRRGALRRFDALRRKTVDLPVVVSWDRRLQERRNTPSEAVGKRRTADRRQSPPFTWELADFVVVATASATSALPVTTRPTRRPAPSRTNASSGAASRVKTARTAKRPKR